MSNVARQTWEHQDSHRTLRSPPLANTYQTYFSDLTGWKKINYVAFYHHNAGTNRTLQIRITIDGVTYESVATPAIFDTMYYVERGVENTPASNSLLWGTTWVNFLHYDSLFCESILIEAKLSTLGVGQQLYGWTNYDKYKSF